MTYRTPVRLTVDHASEIQAAMEGRMTHHGAVVLHAPKLAESNLGFAEKGYTLGYRDEHGTLTHFIHGSLDGAHGPFKIEAIAYRNVEQLLELLRLLYELGDQIRSVKMVEPAELQLQVLMETPMRQRHRSQKAEFESRNEALAYWQLRILDLAACVGARHWQGDVVRFNLDLTDPLADHLAEGWQGISGEYTIVVGEESELTPGHTAGLPGVVCDVAAFTRLWFGVAAASSVHTTDQFSAPPDLARQLDRALRLPPTIAGWRL